MSGKTKPPYADAFRQQMVELVATGRKPKELAREFGVSEASIHAWVNKAGRITDLPRASTVLAAHRQAKTVAERTALTAAERNELIQLRRENRQLKLEREILSKATAWFAHKSEKTSLGSIG